MAAESAKFSRARVMYDNGLIVVANAGREPLRWQNMVLPQYGWAAKARGLLAYTAMCGATVCDYAETTTSVFANARNQVDARIGRAYATPSVVSVSQIGGRRIAIAFQWQVHRSMNRDYKTFLHFVDQNQLKVDEGTAFQGDTAPAQNAPQLVQRPAHALLRSILADAERRAHCAQILPLEEAQHDRVAVGYAQLVKALVETGSNEFP